MERERLPCALPRAVFLAVEHAVEFTRTSRARLRHRQRPINISKTPTVERTYRH